jgi:hypothetical protein
MNRNGIRRSVTLRNVTVATSAAVGETAEICSSGTRTATHRILKMTKHE